MNLPTLPTCTTTDHVFFFKAGRCQRFLRHAFSHKQEQFAVSSNIRKSRRDDDLCVLNTKCPRYHGAIRGIWCSGSRPRDKWHETLKLLLVLRTVRSRMFLMAKWLKEGFYCVITMVPLKLLSWLDLGYHIIRWQCRSTGYICISTLRRITFSIGRHV